MTTMSTSTVSLDDRGRKPSNAVVRWLRTRAAWILLLDIGLIAVFSILSRNNVFWSPANAESLLLSVSQILLLALGLAMMLGAGIFDLSLGANLVLSSVVGAMVIRQFQGTPGDTSSYQNVWLAIVLGFAASIATGALFGLVNGLLIAVANINSLIATLGTLGIGTGIALLLTGGSDVALPPGRSANRDRPERRSASCRYPPSWLSWSPRCFGPSCDSRDTGCARRRSDHRESPRNAPAFVCEVS